MTSSREHELALEIQARLIRQAAAAHDAIPRWRVFRRIEAAREYRQLLLRAAYLDRRTKSMAQNEQEHDPEERTLAVPLTNHELSLIMGSLAASKRAARDFPGSAIGPDQFENLMGKIIEGWAVAE